MTQGNASAGRVAGKTIFISAAAQGIGAAAARLLAREGATVIVTDVQGDKAQELGQALGGIGFAMDATDEGQWQNAATLVEQRFGRLDVLVNNVGWAEQKPFWDFSLEEFRQHFRLNTETSFLGSKTFVELLDAGARQRGADSSIVHIASVAAVVGFQGQLPYNAAKAAVVSMSKTMAVEFTRYNRAIRSNVILPGVIDTAILKKWFDGAVALGILGDGDSETQWASMVEMSPMKRLGQPEDIANAILYFASDESAYASGTEIRLDGAATAG